MTTTAQKRKEEFLFPSTFDVNGRSVTLTVVAVFNHQNGHFQISSRMTMLLVSPNLVELDAILSGQKRPLEKAACELMLAMRRDYEAQHADSIPGQMRMFDENGDAVTHDPATNDDFEEEGQTEPGEAPMTPESLSLEKAPTKRRASKAASASEDIGF